VLAGGATQPRMAQTNSTLTKPPPGPFEVETVNEITLHDPNRNQDLPVFVNCSKGDGSLPGLVCSHGALGSGDMGFPIGRHWTRHGDVVPRPTLAACAAQVAGGCNGKSQT
jgi:hypothetical protein